MRAEDSRRSTCNTSVFGLGPEDIGHVRGVMHVRRQVRAINGKLYSARPKGAPRGAV
ncbi:hypothetical protein GZL_01572 [Streptomyces sp. 769]|nr:hypothetical protein GZL_01572 [Streptomyces sp. 769]